MVTLSVLYLFVKKGNIRPKSEGQIFESQALVMFHDKCLQTLNSSIIVSLNSNLKGGGCCLTSSLCAISLNRALGEMIQGPGAWKAETERLHGGKGKLKIAASQSCFSFFKTCCGHYNSHVNHHKMFIQRQYTNTASSKQKQETEHLCLWHRYLVSPPCGSLHDFIVCLETRGEHLAL